MQGREKLLSPNVSRIRSGRNELMTACDGTYPSKVRMLLKLLRFLFLSLTARCSKATNPYTDEPKMVTLIN